MGELAQVPHYQERCRSGWLSPPVIRLSLGKLLGYFWQVVERTNTPIVTSQMASSTDHGFIGSWVRFPPSIVLNVYDFPHVELEKYSPRYPQEMKPLGYLQVRPYIQPTCHPAVSGGESVIRLSFAKAIG